MLRKSLEMEKNHFSNCHEGEGKLLCTSILQSGDSKMNIWFMHYDEIEPGASIGQHLHEGSEELYYIISGQGNMYMDGVPTHVEAGDVSLVHSDHSHGIQNVSNNPLCIIVLCVKNK